MGFPHEDNKHEIEKLKKRIEELEECIKALKDLLWVESTKCCRSLDSLDSGIELCTKLVGKS